MRISGSMSRSMDGGCLRSFDGLGEIVYGGVRMGGRLVMWEYS